MLNIPTAESQRFESHHVWRPFEALDPRSTASILSSTLADRVPTIGPRDLLSPPDCQGALDYLNDICRGDPNFPVKFTEIPKLSMSPQELEAFIDEFIESYNSATREVPNLNIMPASAAQNWMPTPDLTPSSSITTPASPFYQLLTPPDVDIAFQGILSSGTASTSKDKRTQKPLPQSQGSKSRSIYLKLLKSEVPASVSCRWIQNIDGASSSSSSTNPPVCGMAFSSFEQARDHLAMHCKTFDFSRRKGTNSFNPKKPACQWSGCTSYAKQFSSRATFEGHFHSQHHPYTRVYCPYPMCEAGFKDQKGLEQHLDKCPERLAQARSWARTPGLSHSGNLNQSPYYSALSSTNGMVSGIMIQSPLPSHPTTASGSVLPAFAVASGSGQMVGPSPREEGSERDDEHEDRRKRIRLE